MHKLWLGLLAGLLLAGGGFADTVFLKNGRSIKGKVIAESLSSIAVPYPKEYVDLIQDQKKLKRIATVAGGLVDPKPPAIFAAGKEKIRYHKDFWNWLLYVALGLLLVDVLLRPVRIFGYRAESMS